MEANDAHGEPEIQSKNLKDMTDSISQFEPDAKRLAEASQKRREVLGELVSYGSISRSEYASALKLVNAAELLSLIDIMIQEADTIFGIQNLFESRGED